LITSKSFLVMGFAESWDDESVFPAVEEALFGRKGRLRRSSVRLAAGARGAKAEERLPWRGRVKRRGPEANSRLNPALFTDALRARSDLIGRS
jgi:hypothetical protein